jgi:cytochrome c biogenesis protein CcmG/thiol:disulfide interchange protein DsbE
VLRSAGVPGISFRFSAIATALLAVGAAPSGQRAVTKSRPPILVANLKQVQDAIRKPGARAVLVNMWATFCEPCREEMPALLRVFRAREARGLRLVLVSADDEENRVEVQRVLGGLGVNFPTYLKTGDDMAFINGIDQRWTGALPASFLFDGQGQIRQFWPGQVTAREVEPRIDELLQQTTNASTKGRTQ